MVFPVTLLVFDHSLGVVCRQIDRDVEVTQVTPPDEDLPKGVNRRQKRVGNCNPEYSCSNDLTDLGDYQDSTGGKGGPRFPTVLLLSRTHNASEPRPTGTITGGVDERQNRKVSDSGCQKFQCSFHCCHPLSVHRLRIALSALRQYSRAGVPQPINESRDLPDGEHCN